MRVVFIGTGAIGLPALKRLHESAAHQLIGVVTQPDKPAGRDLRLRISPIKDAAARWNVPVLQPKKMRAEEAVAALGEWQPDVIIVMAYGQILPGRVLELPAVACLNLHASLLPRHRGAAPIQAAIMAGDATTGITVMYMDEGLDTGDLLLQKPIPIEADETGESLHDRLANLAPEAMIDALELLGRGAAPRVPQNATEATYAPKLEREHGRIDWSAPAQVIERMIRAYHPWPGAFTVLKDLEGRERKLKVLGASLHGEPAIAAGAFEVRHGEILAGAADGNLRLERLQLEGKRPMSGEELLRGHPWIHGSRAVAGVPPPRSGADGG